MCAVTQQEYDQQCELQPVLQINVHFCNARAFGTLVVRTEQRDIGAQTFAVMGQWQTDKLCMTPSHSCSHYY